MDRTVFKPEIDRNFFPRENRCGKPRLMTEDLVRIEICNRFKYCPAGDAVGAEPMKDRPREAGALGHVGIRVQRVAVAAQPIQQGLLGQRRHVDGESLARQQLAALLNRDLLVEDWPRLMIPRRAREAWEARFPELTSTETAAPVGAHR